MTAILRASAAGLTLGALVVATTPAFPATPGLLTHEEARQAIQSHAEPEARRAAVQALGETGTSADQPLLVAALRDDDQIVRAMAESALWQVWSRAGDLEVDRLFVEGWNKRATVYYLLGEFDKSLADCDEVIKRNPDHFGALSGYGMIYLQLDQPERALDYFRRALAVNPNLRQVRSTIEQLRRLLRERGRETT
jgi:tetratricopeptide (TPR) repeat protein